MQEPPCLWVVWVGFKEFSPPEGNRHILSCCACHSVLRARQRVPFGRTCTEARQWGTLSILVWSGMSPPCVLSKGLWELSHLGQSSQCQARAAVASCSSHPALSISPGPPPCAG